MLKAIGSNWALNVVQTLVFMILSPFVVKSLGQEVNGIWTVIVSLTGFLQLLILGVPMASVRYIAQEVAKKDGEGVNRAISTCLAICLVMGAVALVVGGALFWLFETQYLQGRPDWAHLGADVQRDARLAFGTVLLYTAFGFAANLPSGIYDAHLSFMTKNLVKATGLFVRLGLTLALLSYRASLSNLALVLALCVAFDFLAAYLVLKRRHPEIRFGLTFADRTIVRGILSFSVFAMLLNVGSKLAFQSDALVIGFFMKPDQVTVYDIGFKIFDPFTNIILAIGMVVMPMATTLKAQGTHDGLQAMFEKWTKIAFTIVLLVGTYLLILGPEFLNWWFTGEDVTASGPLLQILMASFLVFLPARGVALPILMGLGRQHRPAIALLLMGFLNVAVSVALIGPYGLYGVALGTAIPNTLFAVAVTWFACRELGTTPGALFRYAGARSLIGIALPAGFLWFCKQELAVAGFFPLLFTGLAYVALFGLIWIMFVFKGDQHIDPWARLMARKNAGGAA